MSKVMCKITKDGEPVSVYVRPARQAVYEQVLSLTGDVEAAIEADSWSELAAVGEVFEIRDLVIEVVEEDGI